VASVESKKTKPEKKFKLVKLDDFVPQPPDANVSLPSQIIPITPPLPPLEDGSLPIDYYNVYCPYTGSTDVIRKGYRKTKFRGNVPLYLCRDCGRKFTLDSTYHTQVPLRVHGKILDYAAEGTKAPKIAKKIKDEMGISLTPQAISSLIKRDVRRLLYFEELLPKNREPSELWYTDEMKQLLPQGEVWVINVMDANSRYWLITIVCRSLNRITVLRTFKLALKRGFAPPGELRSDGLQANISAAKRVLPETKIVYRTKIEDIAIVNLIETLHNIIRETISRRRFHSPRTIENHFELRRIYYNFIRPHGGVGSEVPARAIGIPVPKFGNFEKLLGYADRFIQAHERRHAQRFD
jgi:hypothetical protein